MTRNGRLRFAVLLEVFFLCGAAGATPADLWRWMLPFELGNSLNVVRFIDDRFVVGGNGGAVLISDDGRTWRDRSLHRSGEFYGTEAITDFASTPDGWIVAANYSGWYAQAETFDRGETWTLANGAIDRYHTSLAWGNGVFVSIGKYGLQSGLSLSDLRFVTYSPSNVTWSPQRVIFADGRFIAAGSQAGATGYVGISTDGRNWTLTALPPVGDVWSVQHLNDRFVIAASDGTGPAIAVSDSTATTWEKVIVDAADTNGLGGFVIDVAYGNNRWVAVGQKDWRPFFWTSVDGRTWERGTRLPGIWLQSVTYGNGRFVAVGADGLILSSDDAVTWENVFGTTDDRLVFHHFFELGDQMIALTWDGAHVTRNGITWKEIPEDIPNFKQLATDGSRLVGLGLPWDEGNIWLGETTSSWRQVADMAGETWSSLSVANGRFLAISDSGKVYHSVGGEVWASAGQLPATATESVVYGNGQYFVSAGWSLYASTDLATWSPVGVSRPGLAFDGQRFVSIDRGFASVSEDGITWSDPTQLPLDGNLGTQTTAGGGWIAVSSQNGHVALSRDGVAWQRAILPEAPRGQVAYWRDRFWIGAIMGGLMQSEPLTAPGDFVNLSTRGLAGEGEDTLIAGTIVAGEGSADVLVRGVGPGLEPHLSSFATDPRLTLFRSGEPIAANDNWEAYEPAEVDAIRAAAKRVGAFALKAGSTDASLLSTFTEGVYTAHVGSDPSGISLVELYVDGPATSRLVNLSTRGRIGSRGGEELIVGFIIPPGGAKMVLIRGVGSELAEFDVTHPAADPVLVLHDMADGRVLDQNDNWGDVSVGRDAIRRLSELAGAFPLADDSRSAALVAVLPPGIYTAVITDKNQAGGVALAEIYELAF